MNTNYIAESLQGIGKVGKTTAKAALLAELGTQAPELTERVLSYTYNPFITYGFRVLPSPTNGLRKAAFDDETWRLLDDLAARRLTGNNAKAAVAGELAGLHPLSAWLLSKIILKDLDIGIAETSINKTFKGLIPVAPYMRCALPDKALLGSWPWEQGVFSQSKADGMFVNTNCEAQGVTFTSRAGRPLMGAAFDELAEICHQYLQTGTQTHGEMLVVGPDGKILPRAEGNGKINQAVQSGAFDEGHHPILHFWDQIPLENAVAKGSYSTPYGTRWLSLVGQIANCHSLDLGTVECRVVYSLREAYQHCVEELQAGREGTVVKHPAMDWRDTGSSANRGQVKLKLEAPVELRVTGFVPGKASGKHAQTFGSLQCESACSALEVAVSGISDKLREEINADREGWMNATVTVLSNAILYSSSPKKKHSLFLPRFVERRYDTSADTLKEIEAQFAATIEKLIGEDLDVEPPTTVRRIARRTRPAKKPDPYVKPTDPPIKGTKYVQVKRGPDKGKWINVPI